MSKLGRPIGCEGADTRNRLLVEARRSFATEGFDATTNKSLAKAAGITTAAIYHYFPSKVDMYVAVLPIGNQIGRILLTIAESAVERGEVNPEISARSLEDMLMVVLAGLARFNMVYRDSNRTAELVRSMKLLLAGAAFKVSAAV